MSAPTAAQRDTVARLQAETSAAHARYQEAQIDVAAAAEWAVEDRYSRASTQALERRVAVLVAAREALLTAAADAEAAFVDAYGTPPWLTT